ncbi:CTTNBP2 N-terminal like b isoform X2 [Brienomyrus brachyistius]|nr:CTTNBP2 N-terminal like b isoform X2 [Brienomyrus brachyistius]XP_048873901.1 CTTNBP2 N-terminal like b isoform X2 [Brienomyrus brachyistius]XP_048873902.1 CTTNBP2 N-terminal like b isoform X2 [Brienomyrus brachyistius]
MDVESLSKPELLMLFSVLEGELEARDLVIEALRAQQQDAFVQERYGRYRLSDPFLALQRDTEAVRGLVSGAGETASSAAFQPSPMAVLQLVIAHSKRMQQKTVAQLVAAEKRHRKVIADLEEEKQRHAQDSAQGDDVTYMLEKERERLLQELDFEKGQVKRLEKEQKMLVCQLEEGQAQNEQLSTALALECQRATAQALEDSQRVAALQAEMQAEREQATQAQERFWHEEGRRRDLQAQVEGLLRDLAKMAAMLPVKATTVSTATQTEPGERPAPRSPALPKINGHHQTQRDAEGSVEKPAHDYGQENGVGLRSPIHPHASLSPSSTASSSLTSSPCSSPVLAKRLGGAGALSPGYQSSYQASVNQRFQAARHKFQAQAEQEHSAGGPASPHDLSPTTAEHTAKQLARHTVTQVLSRFTSQQGSAKPSAPNNSPFGTDYRSLACLSPTAKSSSPLSPGIKSPTVPRGERVHPPPIPPKKPDLAQSPASPGPPGRASHFPELSGSCCLTSTQEGAKELDLVVSSTS